MIHPARNIFDAIELPNHGAADMFARLESAAQNAATSAYSRNPPTLAQRMASDYAMGEVVLHGIPVRIECPRNTWREGVAPDGKPWRTRLAAHYGDFPGTRGNDGDPVDGFFGPFPESTVVWVINQRHIGGNRFDEHKAMVGFVSEQQARGAYMDSFDRGWTGLMSIVRATVGQFKQWLKSGDKSHPFSVDQPLEGNRIMDKVLWNTQAEPVTTTLHRLMYDLRVSDGTAGLMLDSTTMADLMGDPDIEGVMALDALVVEVNRMSIKMDMLKKVMEAAGGTVKPTEVTISDPVKSRGVLQVMVLFQMSDGQTIAIWFHNPDTTPAKLMPLDELISWKWMLNKKDVTIVVAPERGKELNVREVARRVMRLVERNSEAYQKANAKAGERAAESAALDTEITGLEGELTDLNRQIELIKVKKEDENTAVSRKISALLTEQSRVFTLIDKEKQYGLGADSVKLEALMNEYDDLANQVRVLRGEAEVPRSSWATEKALRDVKEGRAANGGKGLDPANPEDYHKIRNNPALQVAYQDTLDPLFQARIIETRNALREIGWEGEQMGALSRNGAILELRIEHAGPGSNVVGVRYYVTGNIKTASADELRDDLSVTPQELAKELDMAVSLWSPEETEARRAGTYVEPEVVTPDPAPVNAGGTVFYPFAAREFITRFMGGKENSALVIVANEDGTMKREKLLNSDAKANVTRATNEMWREIANVSTSDIESKVVYAATLGPMSAAVLLRERGVTVTQDIPAGLFPIELGALYDVAISGTDGQPETPPRYWEGCTFTGVSDTGNSKGMVVELAASFLHEKSSTLTRVPMDKLDDWLKSGLLKPAGAVVEPAPEPEKKEETVPDNVRKNVEFALSKLKEISEGIASAKTLEVKFGAPGRYEADAIENRKGEIASAQKTLATFRKHAAEKGIDAEAFIASLGGEADVTPSAEALKWMQDGPAPEPAPEPIPEPIPEPVPEPVANPAKAADTAYLQSLADGTADMFAADVFERLEPMFASYEADADMMALLERAAQAYGDAAVKAAQAALATA